MKTVALVLTAMILLAAAVLWTSMLGRDAEAPAVMEPTIEEPRDVAHEVGAVLEGRQPVQKREPATTERAQSAGEIEVRGSVTIVDEYGNRFTEEDGVLELRLLDEKRVYVERAVPFERGSWSANLPADRRVVLWNIHSGRRSAWVERDREGRDPAEGVIDFAGVFRPRTTLRVVSQKTGELLDDVTVAVSTRVWAQSAPHHPGAPHERTTLVDSDDSPFELPYFDSHQVRVAAPGHAWSSVRADFETGGEHVVSLRPGGDLRIVLDGDPLPDNCSCVVFVPGRIKFCPAQWTLESGVRDFTIDSLPVGEFQVILRQQFVGPPLFEGTVKIEPGQTVTLRATIGAGRKR